MIIGSLWRKIDRLPSTLSTLTKSYSTETLIPVKLSYATYESAVSKDNKVPPLIIMHGLFGSKSNWNSVAKLIQKKLPQRKVITIDARNHGDSPHDPNHTYAHMAADLKALVADLNVPKVALLGHSMGGRAVMLFALKYPEVVEKLLVSDISPVSIGSDINGMSSLMISMLNAKLPTGVSISKARAIVDEQLYKDVKNKAVRQFLLTNLVQKEGETYKWRLNLPVLLENMANVSKFPSIASDMIYTGPTIFFGGKMSDYLPEKDHAYIRKFFPKAEFAYLDAGHWIHADKPVEFVDLLANFVNK